MSIRLSPTKVVTAAEIEADVLHSTSTGSSHSLVLDNTVKSTHAGINLEIGSINEISAALSGSVSKKFKPTKAIFRLTQATAPGGSGGDAHVTIGTGAGGTQILPDTTLTGLNAVGEVFEVALTGLFPDIAGNATLFVKCITGDTTGTGMLATAEVIGEQS